MIKPYNNCKTILFWLCAPMLVRDELKSEIVTVALIRMNKIQCTFLDSSTVNTSARIVHTTLKLLWTDVYCL